MWWIFIASLLSNGIWIFVIKQLIPRLDNNIVILMYILFTSLGSTFGAWANIKLEKKMGAKT